ncbi:hypothetical protein XH90_27105 [Bradyrhizobium sp. CCBAU 53338]|nr:hypothetical protein XH90_27105 [Bradyrhizobium sp. CCBAU 53338]
MNARRDTPHPSESVSTCVAALSHKGRGRVDVHRARKPHTLARASVLTIGGLAFSASTWKPATRL